MASINTQRPPSSIVTFLLGIGTLAIFAAIIVGWTKMRAPKADLVDQERGAARLKKREELEKDWASKLQTVAWVNKEKGEVQMPIDTAIKAVAADLKAKKVAKTEVKVPAILPPPPVDPKSTEPPPPLATSAPQGADLIRFGDPVAPVAAPAAPAAPAVPVPPIETPPAPVPPPAIPAPAIPPAAPNSAAAAVAPVRPPLINWTESK